MSSDFKNIFQYLTGNPPFPWQMELYRKFIVGEFPDAANIPTGLGKTSIVAIWLIALALHPEKTTRRLVYVVNRRTVVDQTTDEVKKLREALAKVELDDIRDRLTRLCALPLPSADAAPLAISTLRGKFADNGEWLTDPSRPAVVIGTVDMIGSGLLFSRYTRGFKTRPLHAGFLAQDALLVHDEAHLEPAFQKLLKSIAVAQKNDADLRPFRIIELTATSRSANTDVDTKSFGLDENAGDKDTDDRTVIKRYHAIKQLLLVELGEGEKLDAKLVSLAVEKTGERAVLIFTRSVETAIKVAAELDKNERKGKVATLTGTMRGKERDKLVTDNDVFQRFLPISSRSQKVTPAEGTVFLVATSAGEVGVNISADDLFCDLSTYESMAQRFGRVNRFGELNDTRITVVHETEFSDKSLDQARQRTLVLLEKLAHDASPASLGKLPPAGREAAFSPEPNLRVATEIQFDAWALTSIRKPIAARPPVEPYLHGEAEWQPPETHLAWRKDNDLQHIEDPEAFMDEFPLKPAELLRDTTARIVKTLGTLLGKRQPNAPKLSDAWLLAETGSVTRFDLSKFDTDDALTLLANAALLLPASIGGLANGLFTGAADTPVNDVSEIIRMETDSRRDIPAGHRLILAVETSKEDADEQEYLLYLKELPLKAAVRASLPETLATHAKAVEANAAAIADKIFPATPALAPEEPDLRRCLILAARLHDLGKNRAQWQRNLGNLDYDPAKTETILAKSAPGMTPRNVAEHYRHEFGSLNDASGIADLATLSNVERDIVLHLVATHHGRARPHFPAAESFDYLPTTDAQAIATEIPCRFARLQKRFGRWGLAWLESLLRAADYAASAGIVATNLTTSNISTRQASVTEAQPEIVPSATLNVNPANPGHYFACCGLFELASRLAPDALAWFEHTAAGFQFHLANTSPLADLLGRITAAEITVLDPTDATASPISIAGPFNLRVDWWKTPTAATSALKVWAGTMEAPRIARAMQKAIQIEDGQKVLSIQRIAYSPEDRTKKVEPFYFDANRGPNSDARDVGFSPNDLSLETLAAPAAEFLTLIGLQRGVPQPSGNRLFTYHLWQTPVTIPLLAAAINGLTEPRPQQSFRFESWYRTSQRKHKAFLPAKSL